MKMISWPEALLWQHYVHAQLAAAASGLISGDMVGLAVGIADDSLTVHAVVSRLTDEVVEDLDDICFELDVLLEGKVPIKSELRVGFGPIGAWPPAGVHRIYVAKGARDAEAAGNL